MVDQVKISDLPQADLPSTGEEFSEVVQDGVNKRIDDNDRTAGQVKSKTVTYTDAYDPDIVFDVEAKFTPYEVAPNWFPGFSITVNRTSVHDPYGEKLWFLYASYGSMGVTKVESLSGGRYRSYDTTFTNRGLITTVASRLSPIPTDQWDVSDTSAAIFLDCATALPATPTEPYANAKMIFPFRVGNMNVKLVEPLIQTATTATTLTPARLTEVAEFTALATNATIAAPAGSAINGKPLVIRILATGADRTLTWDAYYRPIGVTLPATAPNGKWVYVMGYFNTTTAKVDVVDVKVQA